MLQQQTKNAKVDLKRYLGQQQFDNMQKLQLEMDCQMADKPDNFDRIDQFIDRLKAKNKLQNLKVQAFIKGITPASALLGRQTPLAGGLLRLVNGKGKEGWRRPQTPASLLPKSLVQTMPAQRTLSALSCTVHSAKNANHQVANIFHLDQRLSMRKQRSPPGQQQYRSLNPGNGRKAKLISQQAEQAEGVKSGSQMART